MERGQVWWANLPAPSGSEPGYRRPVIIVQDDTFNRSRIRTIIAVVLTTNQRLAFAPGNVFLSSEETGLTIDSVANVSQVITVDKDFLTELSGRIPFRKLVKIENGLRLVLSL